jgi:hypothetical protein
MSSTSFCSLMSIDNTTVAGRRGLLASLRTARPPADVSTRSTPVVPCRLLEALLHTQLADVFGTPVVGLVVVGVVDLGFFGLVDTPDVSNHMAGQFTIGVVAKQPGLDFYAGKAKALGDKPRHFGRPSAGCESAGTRSSWILPASFLKRRRSRGRHIQHLGQFVEPSASRPPGSWTA